MSERIRGSYDDALYKSTFTLLYFTLLYFTVQAQGKDFELIVTVNLETSHPVLVYYV